MSVEFQAGQLATPRAGTLVAVDSIDGEAYQRVKLDAGAAGATLPVNVTNPLPVYAASQASSTNNSTTPLASTATFTGTAEQNTQPEVMVSCITDNGGTLYFDFSVDGTNWNVFPTAGFTVAAGVHEFHTAVKGPRYFRVRLVNGTGAQTYLRLFTYYGQFRHGNAPLNQSIGADSDAIITRSVLVGATDGGSYLNVPVTAEGHIEVAVHGPRLPFGSIHTESLLPVFQTDAVYGINSSEAVATSGRAIAGNGSGATTGTGNVFKCATGTTSYSFAAIQSRRRLRYRPGQGTVGRFAGLWSAPAASSIVVAGFGTAESGFYFGYDGTSFGVLHVTGGVRELQTMTIGTASTATNDYVVTLPDASTVNVTATNNSSTARTAYEIARGTFTGWDAFARGSTVLFLAQSAGPKTGTFSLAQSGAGVPAAGTVAETTVGVDATNSWVAQTAWNGDKLDGTGASGFTLNPAKGNVFSIGMQYLGFGTVSFAVEVTSSGNNADFVTVHTLNFPNTLTAPHVANPSFPFTMAASSAGSTTDVSVSVGSFGGFIEGQKRLTGPRMSYFNTSAVTSSTSAYTPIFTVRNDKVYNGKANQSVINLISVGGVAKSNTGITSFFAIRNANLTAGNVAFTSYAATSCSYFDTAATACTFATNDQVVWTGTIAGDGSLAVAFADEITIQPGESITLAVRSVTATGSCVGQLNTREDQ